MRLAPADGEPAAPARPGQFLTVRLRPDPRRAAAAAHLLTVRRAERESYRISVKREPHGAASGYLHTRLRVGDVIEAGAPRGSFVLRPGDRPVVLISAGVGATPVLAMLHVLAGERSARPVWWLHGARNGAEHPFEQEARDLLGAAARRPPHRLLQPPRPRTITTSTIAGRLTGGVLAKAGVPTGRRLLPLRSRRVHGRHRRRADRARRRPRPRQHRDLRAWRIADARRRRRTPSALRIRRPARRARAR